MKQKLNKFKDGIQFGLGILVVISISGITYASYNALTTVESGDPLTKDSWNQMITNQADFDIRLSSVTPSGAIMMFESTCPTGWSEKTSYRNKMIRGESTGNPSNLGTGGNDNAVNVSHLHSVNPPSTTSSSNGSHSHNIRGGFRTAGGSNGDIRGAGGSAGSSSSSAGNHAHTTNIAAFNSASTGVSGTNKNIPAYQEVLFCVKN